MALKTALFLCQKLMEKGRTIVVDIHASHAKQLSQYLALAAKNGYKATSFLLYPPLETCIQRANERIVPDINYDIDLDMINKYWNEVFFVDNEMIFKDPNMSPTAIATKIISSYQEG